MTIKKLKKRYSNLVFGFDGMNIDIWLPCNNLWYNWYVVTNMGCYKAKKLVYVHKVLKINYLSEENTIIWKKEN